MPLSVTLLAPSLETPVLQLGYAAPGAGGSLSASLRLPLLPTKFCQPVEVPREVFALRWGQVRAGEAGGGGLAGRLAISGGAAKPAGGPGLLLACGPAPPSHLQVAGPPYKVSAEVARGAPLAPAALAALLPSLSLQPLPGPEPVPGVASAACVLHCGGAAPRQVPCMVQVAGLGGPALSVTVATADAAASEALRAELAELLAHA